MIYGKLDSPSTYFPLLGHPIWEEALGFLKKLPENPSLGIIQLRGNEMFVNVHTYATKLASLCRFEGHRNMIDVQYIISGGELVDWSLKEELIEDGVYDVERDFQFYQTPEEKSTTRVHLRPGYFGVFFPEDGHRPQIQDGSEIDVVKAVVKIHRNLFER